MDELAASNIVLNDPWESTRCIAHGSNLFTNISPTLSITIILINYLQLPEPLVSHVEFVPTPHNLSSIILASLYLVGAYKTYMVAPSWSKIPGSLNYCHIWN